MKICAWNDITLLTSMGIYGIVCGYGAAVARMIDQPRRLKMSVEQMIEALQLLQQQNFGNAEVGPRTVWLLLQNIIDGVKALAEERAR